MKAKIVGRLYGLWYGVDVKLGAVIDVPASLQHKVLAAPHLFEVQAEAEAPKRRGRPPKVPHGE